MESCLIYAQIFHAEICKYGQRSTYALAFQLSTKKPPHLHSVDKKKGVMGEN